MSTLRTKTLVAIVASVVLGALAFFWLSVGREPAGGDGPGAGGGATGGASGPTGSEPAEHAILFDLGSGQTWVDGILSSRAGTQNTGGTQAQLRAGRAFVPLTTVAEVFGLDCQWDPKSLDLTLRFGGAAGDSAGDTAGGTELILNSTMNRAWIDGVPVKFSDIAAGSEADVLVSLDLLTKALGLYAHYNSTTNQALVASASYPYRAGSDENDPRQIPVFFEQYMRLPLLAPAETRDTSRKLVFSDSPETFHQTGILYREEGSGRFRFYVTHVNGTRGTVVVRLIATNPGDEPVSITTTRRGRPKPSKDYARFGSQALVEWFGSAGLEDRLTVPAHSSVIYYDSGPLGYMDGMHFIDDLETDGPLRFEVAAMSPGAGEAGSTTGGSGAGGAGTALPAADHAALQALQLLPTDIHDRGTFAASGITLECSGKDLGGRPARIRIGDNGSTNDRWVTGADSTSGKELKDYGNYGVFYTIRVQSPGKVAFVLVPVRGYYRGAVLFGAEVVDVPGMDVGESYLLGRTTGAEKAVEIQLCPPSGSYVPFEILIYPL